MRHANLLAIAIFATQWETEEGHTSQSADEKIVGGSEVTDIRQMPYMVAISLILSNCTNGTENCRGPDSWFYTCAGSLLSPLYVVTACHCMATFENITEGRIPAIPMDVKVDDWRYVAGSRSICPLEGTAQARIPLELHHHPQCAREDVLTISDIGIAKMTEPFRINEFVRPVRLFSHKRQKFEADFNSMLQRAPNCHVSGWGYTGHEIRDPNTLEPLPSENAQEVSHILKTAKMDVITEDACLDKLQYWTQGAVNRSFMAYKKLDQICISSPTGNEGFCSGDSGGPFVCNGYFVALVSNSIECGTALPQVCQMVLVLFDWLGKDFCTLFDCSDIVFQQDSAKGARPQTPPSATKVHGGAKGSFIVEVIPHIVTILLTHLLINSM